MRKLNVKPAYLTLKVSRGRQRLVSLQRPCFECPGGVSTVLFVYVLSSKID